MIECDIAYPGLTNTTGNSTVTLSHGVRPSQFTIEVALQPNFIPFTGTIQVLQNGRTVVQFRDCAIDGVFRSAGPSTTFTVQILDRRWKWIRGGGVMVGHFNVRKADKKIIEGTGKSVQELAKMCLDQLGEQGYDVSQLPSNVDVDNTPEVEWDYTPTFQALDDLVSRVGCRVVLCSDDRIRIFPLGYGRNLPNLPTIIDDPATIESVAVPDGVMFIAGPSVWQGLLKLEAVGLDLDGKIKPINELSYKPSEGWEANSPDAPALAVEHGKNDKEKEKARSLAAQSVWRWFRVVGQADGQLGPVQGYRGEVTELWQYELLPELIDSAEDQHGNVSKIEPYAVGQWYDSKLGTTAPGVTPGNTLENTRFPEEVSIDPKTSVVRFPRPMYRLESGGKYGVPQLWVFAAYHIKQKKSRVPERYTYKQSFPKQSNRSGHLPLPVTDVFLTIEVETEHRGGDKYVVTGSKINESEVDRAARYYIQAKMAEILPDQGQDVSYGGFENISPDGKVQQVTWSLQGGVGYTRASVGTEHSSFVPRYKQRERVTKLEAIESKEATSPKAMKK